MRRTLDELLEGTGLDRAEVTAAVLRELPRTGGAEVVALPTGRVVAAQAVADAQTLLVDDWRLDTAQRERLQAGLRHALALLGGGT